MEALKKDKSMDNNLVDFATFCQAIKDPDLRLTLSSREIRPDYSLLNYLKLFYMPISGTSQIDSVYGSTMLPSPMYGGRSYNPQHSLTEQHIEEMEEQGINLSLTLSNHLFDQESYRKSWELLERHHQPWNAVICVSDEMARNIRKDFPSYTLKASVIKNLKTVDKVSRALELYDQVVTPMAKNDDDAFLEALPEKHRIVLFGNAGCAYTCPAKTCYIGFSQSNQHKPVTGYCSEEKIPRLNLGYTYFNITKFRCMGFSWIKLVPTVSDFLSDLTQQYNAQVHLIKEIIK